MAHKGSAAASPCHFDWKGELAGGLSIVAYSFAHHYIGVPPPLAHLFEVCEESAGLSLTAVIPPVHLYGGS